MCAPDVADTFKTTYLTSKDFQMTKPIDALKTIARYVEAKKPKTLAEAEHMLDLISVMADETILHEDAATSPPGPKSVEHRSRRWAQPHLCRSDAKGARLPRWAQS